MSTSHQWTSYKTPWEWTLQKHFGITAALGLFCNCCFQNLAMNKVSCGMDSKRADISLMWERTVYHHVAPSCSILFAKVCTREFTHFQGRLACWNNMAHTQETHWNPGVSFPALSVISSPTVRPSCGVFCYGPSTLEGTEEFEPTCFHIMQ